MTKVLNGEYLVIRKSGGFYHVFDDDAKIINYFYNYRIINGRIGFPIISINKIINTLEEKKINYYVKNSDNDEIIMRFKKNNYQYYFNLSLRKDNINKRIDRISNSLNKMNDDDLDAIIDLIEDSVNE